jgi:hypothetical protein
MASTASAPVAGYTEVTAASRVLPGHPGRGVLAAYRRASRELRETFAAIYRALAQGPLPSDFLLHAEPLPGVPDTYTVPFGDAGILVYVVDQDLHTVESQSAGANHG